MSEPGRLPDSKLPIDLMPSPPVAAIRVPGSKSITNRALILAALSDPRTGSELQGALRSEDTEIMIGALRALGFQIEEDWPNSTLRIRRPAAAPQVPVTAADLFMGNSGTSMRFLTALVSLGHGRYRLDGVPRMRERPIEDLLCALRQLGVNASSERGNGCPPVIVVSTGIAGSEVGIAGSCSSQFLSGLLLVAPLARDRDMTIELPGRLVSVPYVTMTLAMMRSFGATVRAEGLQRFHIGRLPHYVGRTYAIEPDASAASYFFGAAAITGGRIQVLGLNGDSLQGDLKFVDALEAMGCVVQRDPAGYSVQGRPLRGITIDMNAISDTVMTLAVAACFARGRTCITNIGHIRHKETDRIAAIATELRKTGAAVEENPDGLAIDPPETLQGAEFDTYNDHRMAMSLALLGLRTPGVVIRDPGCTAKTYPGFFADLQGLYRS